VTRPELFSLARPHCLLAPHLFPAIPCHRQRRLRPALRLFSFRFRFAASCERPADTVPITPPSMASQEPTGC